MEKMFQAMSFLRKQESRHNFYSIFFFFCLSLSVFLSSYVYAEEAGPGWFMGTAEPVSPEEAEAYYNSQQTMTAPLEAMALSAASATTATNEIIELARALRYDPKLIYDYVHNHIDYVPYFGSLKGATLTYLDGSGNDFDQASLMIALLRESSTYNTNIGTVQYVYGQLNMPGDTLANWLGVDNIAWWSGGYCYSTIGNVLGSGGIPVTLYRDSGCTKTTYAYVNRVWVKANINLTDYLFDPAFKSYQYTSKIDIGGATSYNQSELLSAAQAGATVGTDYVQNLNEGNIGSKLATYSTNLLNTIRSQYPNTGIKEIISGKSIVQTNLADYQTTLPFQIVGTPTVWTDIPADKTATLRIRHYSNDRLEFDYTFNTHELLGKRITLTYSGSALYPELRLDGELIASGAYSTSGRSCKLRININHPYSASGGAYADQQTDYYPNCGSTYAIVYNFGGVSDMLLQKRQGQLDNYLAQGLPQTSESVLGETLNIMGLTWLKELQTADSLLSSLAETVSINHHRIGLMAQETGYYIDVKTSFSSIISNHNIDADTQAHFKTFSLIGSAFEHGMLEQMMGSSNQAVSTMKLFKIANATGRKVFLADSVNYASVQPQLQNYTSSDLTNFQTLVNSGYALILPDNGQLILNNWEGKGYIAKKFSGTSMSMQMAIGGGYFGGFCSVNPCNVNVNTVNTILDNQINNSFYFFNTYINQPAPYQKLSTEPVDMAGGSYIFENTDLSLGGSAPLGLAFSRSYNSSLNLDKRKLADGSLAVKPLGYGWTHNYDIYLDRHSDGNPGLGRRQPVDAATTIAGLYVMLDLIKTQDNIVGWMTTSLLSKWAVDQLIYNQATNVDNAVTVHMGHKVMEFIKLPDGTYAAPPGNTTQLVKNVDNTYSLKERFGAQMDFNSSNKISQLKDVDGNTMIFTYASDNLSQVKDAFNRTLTLTYSNGKLATVADSAGRSVSYGYTGDDLTSYTDPETKVWGYGYNDANHPHRMTSLTNPLSITTATNAYDSLGRVKTQTVPRQTGNAVYNFYFSGFRNAEQDPDGYNIIYHYDEKGRPIATEKELTATVSLKSSNEYDGQFHVIKTKDPRNYETNFLYDGNQNLIRATNALTQSIDYVYDLQFRLTDTIDPLYHGSHFEYDAEHHPTLSKYGVQYDTNYLPIDNGKFQTGASYYANGFPQTTTDGRSTQTTLTYDSYGNLYTTQVGSHPVVKTAHDLNLNYQKIGLLTSLTDQVNTTTNFPLYNNRGQLKKKTDPLGKDTIFNYDNAGRLSSVIDRNNNTITYSYTPTSKIDTITYQDASTVHFTYDNNDSLVTMQDSVGTTGYGYDAVSRLTSSTFTYTYNPASFTVAYSQYDENGNLTELTYPGNKKVIYTYDELNRLKTVKIDWLNQTATYYYDDAGRVTSLVNFNGTVTNYGYDNATRLTSLDNKKSDSTILASYSFTLDGNGNRTGVSQNEPLTVSLPLGTTNYGYNPQKNRLWTAGAYSFVYDNEGQLSNGYSATYTFDYEHRLVTAGTNQYSYDGGGNRVQVVRSGVTTRYIHDASGNLLAEADGSNNITRYYIYGTGLLAMVTTTNDVYTYHFNAVGNTIAMTDSSQIMVNKYVYDPFGNVVNYQETVVQPFKFVGQHGVMTEPNGFYYMRARYYDPQVGRFISEDPIGFEGGDVNLFAYVGNNPVMRVDPSGLELRIYNRPVNGGPLSWIGANHAFFYSTETDQFWGTAGSSGSGAQADERAVIDTGSYNVVPNPQNIPESDVMNYMRDTRNSGVFIPGLRDCHSAVDRTLEHFGLENPGAPGGRLGTIPSRPSGGSGK